MADEDEDLVYPWGEEANDGEHEEHDDGAAGDGEPGARAGSGHGDDEGEADAEAVDVELAFEDATTDQQSDESNEEALLWQLRQGMAQLFRGRRFHLEPFGSYVTGLGLPSDTEVGGRSDLDVVLLFEGHRADSIEAREVRRMLVSPTIDQLAAFIRRERGLVLKNVVPKARVPIVTFDSQELSVDISVQQPWGVLNSWHLRDLCASGWPGRLRALTRLVKLWAKSKAVHTAKDGALSSYGYSLLAAAFLQDAGALPALLLLPSERGGDGEDGQDAVGPYINSDQALGHVLEACSGGSSGSLEPRRPGGLWRAPEPLQPSARIGKRRGLDQCRPAELFEAWLDWMLETVFGYVDDGRASPGGVGRVPLEGRHIVSVRGRSQEELRQDVAWSAKWAEHWAPERGEVFMLVEEPLNGENVARCVRSEGFDAIFRELLRARETLAVEPSDKDGLPAIDALLALSPMSTRQQPPVRLGAAVSVCFSCGQPGHLLRDCPLAQRRPEPPRWGANHDDGGGSWKRRWSDGGGGNESWDPPWKRRAY